MVGIVIISHSQKAAEGIADMALQMCEGVPLIAAGGTKDGRLGTDIDKISDAISKVYSDDGVLILFDLGSAFMNAEMAVDMLSDDFNKSNIEIADCALVEGAITAALQSSMGSGIKDIIKALEPLKLNKIM